MTSASKDMSVGREVGRDTGFVNVGARFFPGTSESLNMESCFFSTSLMSMPTWALPLGLENAIAFAAYLLRSYQTLGRLCVRRSDGGLEL